MSETANISAATDKGPGFAWLDTNGLWSGNTRLSVKRLDAIKRQFLGPAGWQDAAHQFAFPQIHQSGGNSRILVGPDVCRFMQSRQFYDLTLTDGDNSRSFSSVVWPSLPRGGGMSEGDVIQRAPGDPRVDGHGPISGRDRPVDETDATQNTKVVGPESEGDDKVGDPPRGELTVSASRRWNWLLTAAGSLLLLLIIVGLAYYFLGCDFAAMRCGPGNEPNAPVVAASVEPSLPSIEAPVSVAAAPVAAPLDGPEQWWAIINDRASSPETLLALGERLRAPGGDQERSDIGYDAIYAAASPPRNDPTAQYLLASINDPLNPNVQEGEGRLVTALSFYKAARDTGHPDAGAHFDALCNWAKDRQATDNAIRDAYATHCQ